MSETDASPAAAAVAPLQRGAALIPRVQRVLQTPVGDGMGELLAYMDEGGGGGGGGGYGEGGALTDAIERRTLAAHKRFLDDFALVCRDYEEVSRHVQAVRAEYAAMSAALAAADGLEPFLDTVDALTAEIAAERERGRELEALRERYRFGAEEQRALEEDPVTPAYLAVLEGVREVHRQSRAMVLDKSSAYAGDVESAAALMESTYEAVAGASEKIARYLFALVAENNAGGVGGGLGAGGGGRGGGGHVNIGADVPEVSSFFLRCLALLREDSPSQWERVLDEAARLRRACVLRRHIRLLTTGSSSSSAGGGAAGGDDPDGARRPLEAELNNPVFFFSTLFAWLHEVIAEETEFVNVLLGAGAPAADAGAEAQAAAATATAAQRAQFLGVVFSGVHKHVSGAVDAVTARLEGALRELASRSAAAGADEQHKGPGGITGGIARFVFAATGKSLHGPPKSDAAAARYASVTGRAQQEQVARGSFEPYLARLRELFTLLQLFHYYGHAVFAPLLGPRSALAASTAEVCENVWQPLWGRAVAAAQPHLLDSSAALAARTATLHRLATAFEAEHPGGDSQERRFAVAFLVGHGLSADPAAALSAPGTPSGSSSIGGGGGGADVYSGNAQQQQRVAALELNRVLTQLVLPPSPELCASVQLLAAVVEEAARQGESFEAAAAASGAHGREEREQQQRRAAAVAEAERGCVATYVQSLLSVPLVLAQNAGLRRSLDSYCCALLEYNSFSAVRDVLGRHRAYFARDPVVPAVRDKTEEMRARMALHLAVAAEEHFFARAAAAAVVVAGDGASADAALSHAERQRRVGAALEALYNLYSIVAARGRLTPLPALLSMRSDDERAAVETDVTRRLAQGPYARLYERATQLMADSHDVLSPEQRALYEDMAPHKLMLLITAERGSASSSLRSP